MFEMSFDTREFEARAKEMSAQLDQLPYVLSSLLNDAAFKTRDSLITQTWPRNVKVRNKSFMRAALRITKATKGKLEVSIDDVLHRGSLSLHAHGGTKKGKGRLAIPSTRVVRGASGVRSNQRPRNLPNAVVKGNLIFQRQGKGKRAKLRLMYKLKPSAQIRQDVPFFRDFETQMRLHMRAGFPAMMAKAMASRRR